MYAACVCGGVLGNLRRRFSPGSHVLVTSSHSSNPNGAVAGLSTTEFNFNIFRQCVFRAAMLANCNRCINMFEAAFGSKHKYMSIAEARIESKPKAQTTE